MTWAPAAIRRYWWILKGVSRASVLSLTGLIIRAWHHGAVHLAAGIYRRTVGHILYTGNGDKGTCQEPEGLRLSPPSKSTYTSDEKETLGNLPQVSIKLGKM